MTHDQIAALLLVVLSGVLMLLAVHPFTTYPVSLKILAKRLARPLHTDPRPPASIALCVCAYNEEAVIEAKLENMISMRQAVPGLEILVYVDAATDRTVEAVSAYRDQVTLIVAGVRQGKTGGMNTLVGMTQAELVVFSDANVLFAHDAITRLVAPFGDLDVGAVCGHLRYHGPDGNEDEQAGSLYWRLEERIKALESYTGSVMGVDGSIFAIRRSLHVPPPVDLIDDMYVSLSILCSGSRIVRVDDAHAIESLVSRPEEEFRRKIRIGCQAFNVHRTLWPRLRRLPVLDLYKYVSHKLLRWFAIYLLAGSAVSLLAAVSLAGGSRAAAATLTAGLLPAIACLMARGGKMVAIRDILAAFLATGIGVARSLRGNRFQTWAPPASSRAFFGRTHGMAAAHGEPARGLQGFGASAETLVAAPAEELRR